jgi:hypothetical protein
VGDIKVFRTDGDAVSELPGQSMAVEKSLQTLVERHLVRWPPYHEPLTRRCGPCYPLNWHVVLDWRCVTLCRGLAFRNSERPRQASLGEPLAPAGCRPSAFCAERGAIASAEETTRE